VHWRNDERRVDYELEPISTYQSADGEYCREYQGQTVASGVRQRIQGRACRQSDGSWRIQY
jgi:surface antigen